MKYADLRKFTDENGAQSIYLFEGEESYFREKGETLIKTRFVQEPMLDYASFDGGTLKGEGIKNLTDAWNSFPFVSQKRVVRVSEFYPTEKEYETYLKSWFENPPQDGILIISNAAKPKTGGAKLGSKPSVTHIDCNRADEETIKKWIFVTCKREGVYADGVTCGKIAAYCVLDMSRIAMETEKLLCYCRAEGVEKLTDEIVDTLVYPDAEYKIYELANALSRKNYDAFVRIINDLSTKGFNELSLLSSLSSHFKTLYEVSMMKGSDKEIALSLGAKEYAVKKSRDQAENFSSAQLLTIYSGIYGAIGDIKSGKVTPSSALKTVIARLFFINY